MTKSHRNLKCNIEMHKQEVTKCLVRSVPIRCNNSNSNQTAISEKGYWTKILDKNQQHWVHENEKQNWHTQQSRKEENNEQNKQQNKKRKWSVCINGKVNDAQTKESNGVFSVSDTFRFLFSEWFFLNLKQLSGIKSKWKEIDLNSQFVCVLKFRRWWIAIDDGRGMLVLSIQINAAFHSVLLVLIVSHSVCYCFWTILWRLSAISSKPTKCQWQTNYDECCQQQPNRKLCVFFWQTKA